MESFAELAVHMEHIAGTHDIAFAVEAYVIGDGLGTPRSAKSGKGMGGVTGGAGGGAQQKSGRVKTTLKSLSLRAILLNAMAACSVLGGWGRLKDG